MPTSGFNYAPQAALALEAEASRIVRTAAFNIEARAKANIQAMHAIKTGALLNANYTMIYGRSDYGRAAAAGMGLAAKGAAVNDDFPEIESPTHARVVNAMNYAFFVDQGTRFMPGRPFMTQAAESERPLFLRAWQRMHLVPGMPGGEY